jgi:hypothetical protein
MAESPAWAWAPLFLLGAFHGANPAMGWLFAVALGMQERRARAVWLALVPLGIGHTLAVGVAILIVAMSDVLLPIEAVRGGVAVLLIGLGVSRLIWQRHLRWGGMRVGLAGLTFWSFLMASAHGAGVMAVPFALGPATPSDAAQTQHAAHVMNAAPDHATGLAATAVHGAGYLAMTALAALLVFKRFGLAFLRTAWVNLDLVWAAALVATGALTLTL